MFNAIKLYLIVEGTANYFEEKRDPNSSASIGVARLFLFREQIWANSRQLGESPPPEGEKITLFHPMFRTELRLFFTLYFGWNVV